MNHILIKIIRFISGIFLIILGIISGFLPILQGWLFILLGLFLLGFNKKNKLVRKFLLWLVKKPGGKKIYRIWWKIQRKAGKKINT